MFVTGHPGSTDRNDTVAELETERDVIYPINIQVVKRRLGVLRQFASRGPEQARQAAEITFSLENALKAFTGEYTGLLDQKVMAKKAADERALRDAVAKNREWQTMYGDGLGRHRQGRAVTTATVQVPAVRPDSRLEPRGRSASSSRGTPSRRRSPIGSG